MTIRFSKLVKATSGPQSSPYAGSPPPRLGYRPALNGARALAVLLVAIAHGTYILAPEWTVRWVTGGFLGVDIFFVMSGFLITTLLLEERDRSGAISLSAFYARRARRLLPAVGVLLLAHATLAALTGANLGLELRTAAAVSLYGTNWVLASGGDVAAGLGHLWSLAVEEQFYMAWPLILLVALGRRRPARVLVMIAAVGIVVATAVRAWLWLGGAGWEATYVRTDTRVDELLMGAVLAIAVRRGFMLRGHWRYLGPCGLGVILVCAAAVHVDTDWMYAGGGFTLVGLAAVLVVVSLVDTDGPMTRIFAWSPAVAVGRASYSLYLWHAPVFLVVAELRGQPPLVRLVLGILASTAATLASYHLVEMPAMRMFRRRSRAGSPDTAAAVPSLTGMEPANADDPVLVAPRPAL